MVVKLDNRLNSWKERLGLTGSEVDDDYFDVTQFNALSLIDSTRRQRVSSWT